MADIGSANVLRTVPYVTIHHGAAPGANTDFATDFTVGAAVTALRITACLSTSSVLNMMQSDGSNENAMSLNAGDALTANALYTFTVGVRRTDDGTETGDFLVYNFQVATDSVIETFMVEGITGGVV